MVMPGQFLERPTLIPTTGGLVLEGYAHRGSKRPLLLVLPPPPLEGGGMDHVVGAELAFAVTQAGYPTLRFNFQGVGASQGPRATTPGPMLADALAAHELARDNAHGALPAIACIGASDAIALELARRAGAAGLLLVNPTLVQPGDVGSLEWPVAVVLPELDAGPSRAAWAPVLELHALTIVPGADRAYHRNLPVVGKAGVALCERASG